VIVHLKLPMLTIKVSLKQLPFCEKRWPGFPKHTEKVIKECHACQVVTPQQIKYEPLLMTKIPQRTWETLAIDLKGPFPSGDHILVVIDYFSHYPIIAILTEITLTCVIQALKEIFTIFSYSTPLLPLTMESNIHLCRIQIIPAPTRHTTQSSHSVLPKETWFYSKASDSQRQQQIRREVPN